MPAATIPSGVLLALTLAAQPSPPPPPSSPASAPAPAGTDAELAAEAPVQAWTFEAEGKAGMEDDASLARKKIRKAGALTIAGGSIGLVGLGTAIAGSVMLGLGSSKHLDEMRVDNGGTLPVDDAKRQRTIMMARTGPVVTGVGAGVFVAGAIMAVVGRRRLKRLRDERRASTVAFGALPTPGGAAFSAEVRF
jgi:hypothetical protein